jgi:hypothetical protein
MKDRQARYQRAGELARELQTAAGVSLGETTQAEAAGTGPIAPSASITARRSSNLRWLVIGGLALGAVIVTGTVIVGGLIYLSTLGGSTPEPTLPAVLVETSSPGAVSTEPGAASVPAEATQPAPSGPVGEAFFRDSSFNASVPGLGAAPEGTIYQGWLTREDGDPIKLDAVDSAPGSLAFQDQSEDPNLLAHVSGFVVSIEPQGDTDSGISPQIICHLDVEPETIERFRLFDEVNRGAAPSSVLLDRMSTQAETYDVHLGYSVQGANVDDLGAAKVHAEHVVNIAGGRLDTAYGDWNADGLTQNPGDDVGLLAYLSILDDYAHSVLATSDATQESRDLAGQLVTSINAVSATAEHGRDVAERIAAADSLDEVKPLAVELDGLKVQTAVDSLVQAARALDLTLRFDIVAGAP